MMRSLEIATGTQSGSGWLTRREHDSRVGTFDSISYRTYRYRGSWCTCTCDQWDVLYSVLESHTHTSLLLKGFDAAINQIF